MEIQYRVELFIQVFRKNIPIVASNEQIELAFLETLPKYKAGYEEIFLNMVAQKLLVNLGTIVN